MAFVKISLNITCWVFTWQFLSMRI